MFIDPIVKHGYVVGVSEAAILRTPARAVPGQAVLQQGLEDHSGHLSVRHQAVFMFMKVSFLVDLKIMEIRRLNVVFFK
jgi:hypothetical protein